ncbi:hypothetical protein [Xanthobacter versatilis]|uniref:hypothetical protein n=1 Tax=Xanthobacter autotrophicus (strain ATCC BAA-1158 / Py2) TaxID=78245 RepID=UPI00372CD64F
MKKVPLFVAAALLTACIAEQEQDTARCTLEAKNRGLNFQWGSAGERSIRFGSEAGEHIVLCMAAAGYRFVITDPRCDAISPIPFAQQPFCYVPMSWPGYWKFRIEREFLP